MNLLHSLPFTCLCLPLMAQVLDLKPRGGGALRIGETSYRVQVIRLSSAPPKGGLPGAVKLEGDLVPQDGTRPFHMVLTVLKDGTLYLLHIQRQAPNAYPDTWSPSLNPRLRGRVRATRLEDRPGGRVEFHFEGGLTGIINQLPRDTTWSGTVWAIFPGG
jgi:hypothetical protein